MIRISLEAPELDRVLRRLATAYGRLDDLMRRLAGVMAEAVEVQFERQGVPPWRPLSPKTIQARKRRGHWPGKILQETGRLAASVTTRWGPNEAAVGTNVEYGVYHQLGTRRMPARPFLRVDVKELLREAEDWLSEMEGRG